MDGEVEDYQVSINPPGLSGGFSGQNVISAVANDARSVFAADVDSFKRILLSCDI